MAIEVGFTLLSSETVPLTRDLALQHRDMESSPTERELHPPRVKYLREKLVNGLFVCPTWATARFQGRVVRMNGRHSSTALCEANGEFPKGLSVHLDTYSAESPRGWLGCSVSSTQDSRVVRHWTSAVRTRDSTSLWMDSTASMFLSRPRESLGTNDKS